MPKYVVSVFVAMLGLTLMACVNTTTNAGGQGGKTVLMKLSGRPVTAEEIIKSSHTRKALREFVFYEAMHATASKRGITLDEKDVDKRVEDTKQRIAMSGTSYEEQLKQMGNTEEELREMMREELLFEEIAKDIVEVTDKDIETAWETDKDQIVSSYLQENHLPDAERVNVTLDKARASIKEQLQTVKMQGSQDLVVAEIIKDAELDILVLTGAEKENFENLILNFSKEQALKTAEDAAAAAAGTSTEGEAGAPPVDGAPVVEGAPPAAEGEALPEGHSADDGHDHGESAPEGGQ
jgi:methanogenic corrinoid protein MtbC1